MIPCQPCQLGEHQWCVRRADVDPPVGVSRDCACSCDPSTPDSNVTDPNVALSRVGEVAARWPERARASSIARAFDELAGELAITPPTSPSERAEIGDAIARFMLAAPDGRSAAAVVRTVVDKLGAAEAMNAAEVLAAWALELAVAAEKGSKR